MVHLFIVIIIFLVLSISLLTLFLSDIISLVISIIILWLVFVRAYYQIKKKNRIKAYLISIVITTILFLFFSDFFQVKYVFWQVLFVVIVYLIAELIVFALRMHKKAGLKKYTDPYKKQMIKIKEDIEKTKIVDKIKKF